MEIDLSNLSGETFFKESVSPLEQIWVDRDNGLNQKAYDGFLRLAIDLNYPLHGSVSEKLKKSGDSIALVMLDISFKRSGLKVHEALQEALVLDQEVSKSKLSRDGFFFRQMGLFYMGVSSYSKGFDEFIKVKKSNSTGRDYLYGSLNMILCMHALGYDYSEYLDKFETESNDLLNLPEFSTLQQQYQALKLTSQAFVHHDFTFLESAEVSTKLSGQARYFSLWLSELPFMEPSAICAKGSERDYIQNGLHWLNGFRLRTIKELLTREDLDPSIKIDAQIERLYLWVWRWLEEPTGERMARIKELLSNIQGSSSYQEITIYSRQMLENSLSWLAFFQGVSLSWYDPLLRKVSCSSGKGAELFKYERQVLDYLEVCRSGNSVLAQDLFIQLEASPVHKNKKIKILPLALKFKDESAEIISEGVFVDGVSKKISVRTGNKTAESVESLSLSRFFYLFSQSDRCKKEQLLRLCFQFNFFSPEDHNLKIANLVARANRMMGRWGNFKTKADEVYWVGKDKMIQVCGISLYSLHAAILNELDLLRHPADASRNFSKALVLEKTWIQRAQLEKALRLSKSTVNRRLKDWIQSKRIQTRGQGKKTEYFILSSLQELSDEI